MRRRWNRPIFTIRNISPILTPFNDQILRLEKFSGEVLSWIPFSPGKGCNVSHKRKKPLVIALTATISLLSCAKKEPVPEAVTRFAGPADFIFQGKVLLTQTSTVDAEDPSRLGVVAVERVLAAPKNLLSLAGEKITLQFQHPESVKPGDARIFFSRISAYGETIVADEMGSLEPKTEAAATQTLDRQIGNAREEEADRRLRERIGNTELAAFGKIVSVKPSGLEPPFESEHNPEWMLATLEVREALKGQGGKTVSFLFPQSNDVMWLGAPKFKEGDEGVFLLRKGGAVDAKRLSLTDPRDVRPAGDLEKVRKMAAK